MAEHNDLVNRASSPRQTSEQSVGPLTGKPSTLSESGLYQQNPSDVISPFSRDKVDIDVGVSRNASSISTELQTWQLAMGAVGPSSPRVPSPSVLPEGGDLGSRNPGCITSPDFSTGEDMRTLHKLDSTPITSNTSPSASRPAQRMRPRPKPFQFQDSAASVSPPLSSGFAFSPLARFGHRHTDSLTKLLNTPTPSMVSTSTPWRSPHTPPPYRAVPPQQPYKRRGRRWLWRPAWIMYVLFLCGVAFAVGHHIFYRTLDGDPADDQLAMLRYGTALAFATKACLVSAVIVAYRQRIWMTVRSKMLSVSALDSLFAATEDLSALWNLEIYKRAKVAITLAILVWLAPLVIILTSNTLSVKLSFVMENSTCPAVRTLNFEKEEIEDWRKPTKIHNLYGQSVSLWNTTGNPFTEDDFDYYTAKSNPLEQIAIVAAYERYVVSRSGVTMEVCGPGWNCTYVVNFTAPRYRCEELASGVGSKVGRFKDHKPPRGFHTDLLLPRGNFSYYAYTSGGDYAPEQMKEVWPGGIPKTEKPFPKLLGAFRTEPILWVGYVERVEPDRILNRTESGWDEAFIPKVFACENYETEYTVRFDHRGGQQTTSMVDRKFLYPVLGTTWLQDETAEDGTNDNTTAYPESNYVYPQDKRHYRRVAAFHSIGSMVRYFINGTVNSGEMNTPMEATKALQTKLIDRKHEMFPYPDIMSRLQWFCEDIVLSLLSYPQFVSVVWAARPHETSGDAPPSPDDEFPTRYPCVRSRFENRYRYHADSLWIVYGIAIALAALGIASGTRAVLENEGRLRDTRFSSIVAATRGPALEKVRWWRSDDDAADLPPDIKNLRVGYRLVRGGGAMMAPTTPSMHNNDVNDDDRNTAPGVGNVGMATPPNRGSAGVAEATPGHLYDSPRFSEHGLWEDSDVRYGFGLEGDVSQLRSEGSMFRGRSRP